MALAPLVSAALSPRRKNMRRDGEISPCNGTTTASPLWITSRAVAVAGVIRAIAAAIANTLAPILSQAHSIALTGASRPSLPQGERGRGGPFPRIGEKATMRGSAQHFVNLPVDDPNLGKFFLMVWIAARAGLV